MNEIEHALSVAEQNGADDNRSQEDIDFRMVWFSLGGRDYGFDIMDVEEISKIRDITYVPNTVAYVRCVYNLRGEIISIIDLRIMLNLPVEHRDEGETDDVLFLRSADRIVGVAVDRVNDVIGVSSTHIQPPPPVFEEINIRYIRGVVENAGNLHIILDSDLVFGEQLQPPKQREVSYDSAPRSVESRTEEVAPDLDYTFVQEALATYRSFHAGSINAAWLETRFAAWAEERKRLGVTPQLQSEEDADAFLAPFYSDTHHSFWSESFILGVSDLLREIETNVIGAWVIGAGEGYDPYSLACLMRDTYPDASISIWAHDSDLLKVSAAPTMIVDPETVSDGIRKHLIQSTRGYMFSDEIRNLVYFEYHDVSHDNAFPDVQIIIARDFLSFMAESDRTKLISVIREKLSPGGIVLIGDREELPESEWISFESRGVRCYALR